MLPLGLAGGYSHYLVDCLSIIVIDLLLAGDNALVIALAVRALPKRQRRMALLCGAWLAVLIRVAVTFLAAKLLEVEYVQFAGGAFVVWIAVKVLRDARAQERASVSPGELWRALGSIVVADLTMSTDNILAGPSRKERQRDIGEDRGCFHAALSRRRDERGHLHSRRNRPGIHSRCLPQRQAHRWPRTRDGHHRLAGQA